MHNFKLDLCSVEPGIISFFQKLCCSCERNSKYMIWGGLYTLGKKRIIIWRTYLPRNNDSHLACSRVYFPEHSTLATLLIDNVIQRSQPHGIRGRKVLYRERCINAKERRDI